MDDEEVLKIAQGLSAREWRTLAYLIGGSYNAYHEGFDSSLIAKQILQRVGVAVVVTALGQLVWAWNEVFWENRSKVVGHD